ncbi:unnamed protein product [Larinioides sclopetarius]|uniref:FHA domain-containing protein n=1 Tax=Larinioides sclopetarius TaxID=280406 RepID=A0AAV2B710_9ARAC
MAMEYFLKQINPANTTPLIICLDREEVTVGRRNIVSLTGFYKVSRRHARFSNKNGRWFVRDLESLNKLYVNFKEVNTDWIPLEIGDIVGFGTPSYIEDGGLVCVFAARNRIKQEIFDEIDLTLEPSNIGAKNSRIIDDKSLLIKQELSPSNNGDYQNEMSVFKSECTFQTNVTSPSSSMLSNNQMNFNDIYDPNSGMAFQNKCESYFKESKPIIKIEPNEPDNNGLLSVKNSSTESSLVNRKLNMENISTYDNSENTLNLKVKVSLKNNIEERKPPLCKDVPSKLKKANMICKENREVGEKCRLNYSIPEKKIPKSSDNLQTMIQKAKDVEEKKVSMLFNDYCKKVAEKTGLNDSIPETKILKSLDKLQSMLQKTKDVKYIHSQMKDCSVTLVRCDSKYFRWPPEIKFSKLGASIDEDAEKLHRNGPEAIRKQVSECHLKRKKLNESIEERKNTLNVALNFKLNKNRVLSSSSEISSDESEYEKTDANILNSIPSDKRKIEAKSKKQLDVKKSLDTSRHNSNSLYKTSQSHKIIEKRRQCFSENYSTKRIKSNKGSENPSSSIGSQNLVLHSPASALGKNVDFRKKEVPCYLRDESAFYVQKNSFCSKYWTPEYNEFETGEVQESLNSSTFIKMKQTAGRTLLTDPKPMEYRSRRMRGREEWFKEHSCQDNNQNERISENINEGTSCLSTNSSKASSSQRFVSSKENSSNVDKKISTEVFSGQVIASSKINTSVGSFQKNSELFSNETFSTSKENSSFVNRKVSTELSSSQTITLSKENTSVASRKTPTERISMQKVVSSKANTSVVNRKKNLDLFSDEALLATRGNSSLVEPKDSIEVTSRAPIDSSHENTYMENLGSSSPTITPSKGNTLSISQKNPTGQISIQPLVSSKENTSIAGKKYFADLFSDKSSLASSGNTSMTERKNAKEVISSAPVTSLCENSCMKNLRSSSQVITSPNEKTSVAFEKNTAKQISSEFPTTNIDTSAFPMLEIRTNTSVASRKNFINLFSDEALLGSSGNSPIIEQKHSIEVISSATFASSRENPCTENLEQSMQDKPDNSALIRPTADTIRMNTSQHFPRRRNSSGCRTRVLVEIQRNADETLKDEQTAIFPQPLEKEDCSSSVMVKPTKNIDTSAFPMLEIIENEKKISKNMNDTVSSVSINHKNASFPASNSNSSFEDKQQMNRSQQKTIEENELSACKPSDTISKIEPKLTKPVAKTSSAQILAKEMLESIFNSTFENKQMNWREQKTIGGNELSTYEPHDTTSKMETNLSKPIVKTSDTQFLPKEIFAPIVNSSFEDKNQMNWREQKVIGENEFSIYKSSNTASKMEPTKNITKKSVTQFLPKEAFSKIDKISIDKKVAIVSPVSHDNFQSNSQSQTNSAPYFHAPIKEKITNRVHSTYILSPIKPTSKPIQPSVKNTANSASDTKLRSHYLKKNIIQWNPKWLEEQVKNKKPPPVVSKGGLVLPLRYSSYDSYLKSFYPMISLEIWECLYRESKPLWLKKEVKNAFYYTVRSNKVQHGFMELQCESVVNENLSFLPCEGNVILLGFNDIRNGLDNSLFGYIHQHEVGNTFETEKMKDWQKVPKEWQENAKIWTFSVHIKKSKKNLPIGSVSVAYGISNIKNKLQLADALVGFKDSPIQNDILKPTKEMFEFCKSISKIPRMQLIQIVSEEIKNDNPHSKLILINAPVATGKTGAIIGIVENLLFSNASKIKLLLCALSDMTVDEIGLRLLELNERCSWRGKCIKFVRFGQSEKIPAKLLAFTLEAKVLKMFKEQNKKVFEERENEIKVLEDKINNVLFTEQLKINNKYRFRKRNDEALKQLMDQLQSLKERSPYRNINPVIHETFESAILNESDVVLATLSSCMHPLMRKFFMSCKGESHACCIIDEISQCTELEVLQCLHPEINRLVLVGDLQQLQPQVSSKYAIECGFKRSMLERISKLFSVQFSCTPPLSLTEQHRMQSQICHFSSKYFYKGELLMAADVDERYKYSPLKPFVVYDILEREMPNPPVNIEDNEPFIIANICAQLLQAVPTASLGVIVPHEDLAALYRIPLSLGDAALKEIEVNTVENYQGIEKDIIVISCVNPSLFAESESFLSCENKMNVAMTRARQSLVICGHVSSLMPFEHWAALINDAKGRKRFISVSTLRHIPFVIMKSICRIA